MSDIDKLERIQRKAARFITRDCRTRTPGHVTDMLKNLDLPLLQERRTDMRLIFLYKVVEGLVPAIPSNLIHISRTVIDWNKLSDQQVSAPTVECFKVRLHSD